MAKVASLFDSEAEAEKAINALAKAALGKIETQVIENFPFDGGHGPGHEIPAVEIAPGSVGATGFGIGSKDPLAGLGLHESEATFFREGVLHGGVLLVVTVDRRHEPEVEEILRQNDGRTARQD